MNLSEFIIRPIQTQDNAALAQIIRQSFVDNQIDHLEGVSLNDPELERLSVVYMQPRAQYWVVEYQGIVKGGVGIAPLLGADVRYCELQKLYLANDVIGYGLAKKLMQIALQQAIEYDYQYCYLETLHELKAATQLYLKFGFEVLPQRLGNTGHDSCGLCMLKTL